MKHALEYLLATILSLAGFSFVYVLSSGPAARLTLDTVYEDAVGRFYSPVFHLTDTGAGFVVESYLRFWGAYFEGRCHAPPLPIGWDSQLPAQPGAPVNWPGSFQFGCTFRF